MQLPSINTAGNPDAISVNGIMDKILFLTEII